MKKNGQFPDESVRITDTNSLCKYPDELVIPDIKEIVLEDTVEFCQHQRHRTLRIRKVTSQLNVPTSLFFILNHKSES